MFKAYKSFQIFLEVGNELLSQALRPKRFWIFFRRSKFGFPNMFLQLIQTEITDVLKGTEITGTRVSIKIPIELSSL